MQVADHTLFFFNDDLKLLDVKRRKETEQMVVKYIDLCAGIGGFRVALNNLSTDRFKCVLSADIKQDAIDTYNINFNETNTVTDIYTLKPEDIEPFDLLCAGFPCQPFSSAGQRKGFSDDRGGMIFKIIEICEHHKPNHVLLENVYNLLTIENGKCIARILELFQEIGYTVRYTKLNSNNFGCAQSRERVYIACTRSGVGVNLDDLLSRKSSVTVKDVLDTVDVRSTIDPAFCEKLMQLHRTESIAGCKISDKRGGKNNINSWDIGYNGTVTPEEKKLMNSIMLERRKKHWAKKKEIDWMDGMPLTHDEILTFFYTDTPELLIGLLDNLVKLKYLRLEKPKELTTDGKRQYKEDAQEGYNICKGKLSFPISKILDPHNEAPTLTATDSHKLAVIIDDKVIRHLNVNEMKKLCGFPDKFIIPEHVNYCDLFGNMATPPVLEAIFKLFFFSQESVESV